MKMRAAWSPQRLQTSESDRELAILALKLRLSGKL
jgi:hypothetical protein